MPRKMVRMIGFRGLRNRWRRRAVSFLSGVLVCLAMLPVAVAEERDELAAVPATGRTSDALLSLDRLMQSFVCENGIPGAALAVAKEDRLVYARGFGYADVVHGTPVQPDAIFRIASISKPITAVAILQLVDRDRVALTDRVSAILRRGADQLGDVCSEPYSDPRWRDVTVEHLLQHRGGWDREQSGDPMFRSMDLAGSLGITSPPTAVEIVRYMWSQPLDFDPGTRYAYSNFGYCVLGRLIECVSGTEYESHVRANLLAPLGITRMQIGRTLPAERAAGEVCYYDPDEGTEAAVLGEHLGQPVPRPYGSWCLEAMDAHGGWTASAVDLVRLASRLQEPAPRGILSEASLAAMRADPPAAAGGEGDGTGPSSYYGFGWSVRPVAGSRRANLWHTGRFAGTSTILVMRHDGFCWAALFNTSATTDGQAPADKIDPLIHQAVDAVEQWPADDGFHQWLNPDLAGSPTTNDGKQSRPQIPFNHE